MFEYSYFRAEGRAKEIAETSAQASRDYDVTLNRLRSSFGAERVEYRDPDHYSIVYHSAHVVPDDLYVSRVDKDEEGKDTAVHALPRAGSAAEARMVEAVGKLEMAYAVHRLEAAFGIAEMPAKHLPPGAYETAFVRQSTVKGQKAGAVPQREKIEISAHRGGMAADPLQVARLDGNYYIRVPNDEEGHPRFTPPGAILMDYRDMLVLDGVEKSLRGGMNPQLAHLGLKELSKAAPG